MHDNQDTHDTHENDHREHEDPSASCSSVSVNSICFKSNLRVSSLLMRLSSCFSLWSPFSLSISVSFIGLSKVWSLSLSMSFVKLTFFVFSQATDSPNSSKKKVSLVVRVLRLATRLPVLGILALSSWDCGVGLGAHANLLEGGNVDETSGTNPGDAIDNVFSSNVWGPIWLSGWNEAWFMVTLGEEIFVKTIFFLDF